MILAAALGAAVGGTVGASAARAEGLVLHSVIPLEQGRWQLEVGGLEKRDGEKLRFLVDETAQQVELQPAESGRVMVVLDDVPQSAERLTVELPGRRSSQRATARLTAVPAQVRQWTIYHVMMGYFANGAAGNDGQISGWRHPNYAGGDLQGVLEKVDYLADLGVDSVWLSPLFAARTSHGYDVTNYYRIGDAVAVPGDEAASLALYHQVVEALKAKGIGVILDLPLNHADVSYDRDSGVPNSGVPGEEIKPRATRARQEAEKTWESWGTTYRYWNFDHAPTRRFLKDVALHWLTEGGAEGLRMDYVRGVPHDFWSELYAEVQESAPGAFLVGECWKDGDGAPGNAREIAKFYAEQPPTRKQESSPPQAGPQFDSLLDFPFQILATDAFARDGSLLPLAAWLQGYEGVYGEQARPTFFLDNHDLARFMAWSDDSRRLQAAISFLAAQSAPIVLFYGTETGLSHSAPESGFVDAGRVPMPWEALDESLVSATAEALGARRDHPSLSHGGHLPLLVEEDLLVIAKPGDGEIAWIAVNLGSEPAEVLFDAGTLVPAEASWRAVLGGEAPARGEDGRWSWRLEPASTAIVVLRD
ncbi:MAG: alpha-amylase family glycosyl hydrolase [Acidobacteriota bacterium]